MALPTPTLKRLAYKCRESPAGFDRELIPLGKSRIELSCLDSSRVQIVFSHGQGSESAALEFHASIEDVEILKDRSMALITREGVQGIAEIYRGSYYKLVPVNTSHPPTLEIDGIHMHRVSVVDPWTDAMRKARLAVRRGSRVLDVCTGLGYTSLASLRLGARRVYTVEASEPVLALASINPWSYSLRDNRVAQLLGRAEILVQRFRDSSFNAIIHDPPRFTRETSQLYTIDLYKEFFRILVPGGRLFHYTGEPGRLRGLNLPGRVSRLLREAGFIVLGFRKSALGVLAVKPRNK